MWRSRKRNTLPRTIQKSFQKLSSSIPNRFERPLGDHLGPIDFENHQEAPKRGPRPPRGVQEKEKTSPEAPQILPKPSKLDLESVQKASWKPCWANALKKLDFQDRQNDQEAPKRGPRPPRGAQEMSQSVPNPSQMEPKTLPNPILSNILPCIRSFQF